MNIAPDTIEYLGEVEETLKGILVDFTPKDQPPGDMAMTAARHLCIGGGGKRIRPILVKYFARALGLRVEQRIVDTGVAAEMIHTASLLHDDVVDNGMFRRGRPTVNSLWGNVVAVMSGDLVLTLALERLSQHDLGVMQEALACVAEMTRGTIAELEARGDLALPLERMRFIADGKTGALFGFCGAAAARFAKNEDAFERFSEFGRCIGIAFQIADDVRDLTGGDAGKPPFADLGSKTPSLPILIAAQRDSAVRRRIADAWAFGSMTPDRLRELGEAVLATGAVDEAIRRMKTEVCRALDIFAPYAEVPGGVELVALAHQLATAFDARGTNEGLRLDRHSGAAEQRGVV